MAYYEKDKLVSQFTEEGCDIKIWSGDCRQETYTTLGTKYLCTACGKIANLDHEVRHEVFPYVAGDPDFLS
jgi:hypothetical protein